MMSAKFMRVSPYKDDELNLPVVNVGSAIEFYESVMGFVVESRSDAPAQIAVLARDDVRIAIAENGGDPAQEGCFFEVDDVEAAFAELKRNGLNRDAADYRTQRHGDTTYKLFFVIAPDGLCYCIGQRQ